MKKTLATAAIALTAVTALSGFASADTYAPAGRTAYGVTTIQKFAPDADLSQLTNAQYYEVLSLARSATPNDAYQVQALISGFTQ